MNSKELQLLLDIGDLLNATSKIKENLHNVLTKLSDSMGMIRGTITILNPRRTGIHIEVAHGLNPKAVTRGHYGLGEGITGRVIQTGRPMIVPKISAEPLFLNRTASRNLASADPGKDFSFICVPIKNRDTVIGSLSVDMNHNRNYDLERAENLLSWSLQWWPTML